LLHSRTDHEPNGGIVVATLLRVATYAT